MIKQIIPLVLILAVSANAGVNYSKFVNSGSQEVDAIEDEPSKTPETSFDIVAHVKQYAIFYGVPAAVALGAVLFHRGAARATGAMSRDDAFRLAMEHFGRTDFERCGGPMQRAINALTDQFVEKGADFAAEHIGFSSPVKK